MATRKRALPRGWYPYDGKDCQREIESYIEGWSFSELQSIRGVGGIVPHAGWYFSGRLAARVFSSLKAKTKPDVVVLYGGHLSSGYPPLIVTEEKWETPLGDIDIDTDMVRSLTERIETGRESPQSGDNTMEVQLAMVKYFFPASKLLAIRSPSSLRAKELGECVAEIAQQKGLSIVAVGSTDLTHYGPNYGFSPKGIGPKAVEWVKKENDRAFVERALRIDIEGLLEHAEEHDSACSAGAAAAAMATSRKLGAQKGLLLDYYTSYEILPDESFVGYAGILY